MRVFISAGEPSGDHHGADLIEAIRERVPNAEFVGFGGDRMTRAGAKLLYPLVELSVMWFLRVLWNIRTFVGLVDRADESFRDERPDAVVVIDYPGFNWHVARKAHERGIPVIYFVPPQLWAWAGWRIKKVKRTIDLALCSLPFEPAWYKARGYDRAEYVGHPFFDELGERTLDEEFIKHEKAAAGRLIAILPGSRTQEITRNLPIMLRAAAKLARGRSDVRFAIACLHERHRALATEILEKEGVDISVEIHSRKTAEIIHVAEAAWSVSGSVSLELMMEALPTVILYKLNRIDLWIARPFIKAKYITLVNLLADAELMPEYLTPKDVSDELAAWAAKWLDDPAEMARARDALIALRGRVAVPGAARRAADRIVKLISGGKPAYAGPHRSTSSRTDAGRESEVG